MMSFCAEEWWKYWAYILLPPKNDIGDYCVVHLIWTRGTLWEGKVIPDSARSLSTIKDRAQGLAYIPLFTRSPMRQVWVQLRKTVENWSWSICLRLQQLAWGGFRNNIYVSIWRRWRLSWDTMAAMTDKRWQLLTGELMLLQAPDTYLSSSDKKQTWAIHVYKNHWNPGRRLINILRIANLQM
jgi:hypothetical protein